MASVIWAAAGIEFAVRSLSDEPNGRDGMLHDQGSGARPSMPTPPILSVPGSVKTDATAALAICGVRRKPLLAAQRNRCAVFRLR